MHLPHRQKINTGEIHSPIIFSMDEIMRTIHCANYEK